MEYVRSIIPEMIALFGPADARYLAGLTGQLIGMQYYVQTAALLGIGGDRPEDFAAYLARFGAAQGDRLTWERDGGAVLVRQHTWRLMEGLQNLPLAAFDAWNGLWEGALAVHNRHLLLEVRQRMDVGDDCFEWRIRARRPSRLG